MIIIINGFIELIKGTGHMVPEWKPKEAYYMFSKFLANEDF